MTTNPESGLFAKTDDGTRLVPLLGVDVAATVTGAASSVTVRQRYRNAEPRPIEAVYVFPLPSDAAIHGFTAEVDGRRIDGRVEERERAFETYDDALADGHGAFLLDQERPNIFTLSVGNLRPGAEVTLELRYVAPLDAEGPAFRFFLPTTVSPRYCPRIPQAEVGEPDHERIDPERLVTVPYGLRLAVDIVGPTGRVECPTHAIRALMASSPSPSTRVELAHDDVALDRDFVLLIEPASAGPALSVACDERGDRYLQVDFIPTLARGEGSEVHFVVDCSGSMTGTSIDEARRALALCVRALDERDHFDIVRFGSEAVSLFGEARPYSAATFEQADRFIRETEADLGGTEILAPLEAIVARKATRARNIVLLTDGQVSNENAVIALMSEHARTTRVFTFGIGAGVSEHLVKEVARVSRGRHELIAPGERVEPKVLRQFSRVRTPALSDVRVDWGDLIVEQAPREVPVVFSGEALSVRARIIGGQPSGEVALVAGGKRSPIPLTGADLERAETRSPIPTMWARDRIRELEGASGRRGSSQARADRSPRDRAREELVTFATAHGLVSSVTSFVAVELRRDQDKSFEPELRRVPVALTAGWGGAMSSSGAGSPPQGLRRKLAAPPMGAAPAPAARGSRTMDSFQQESEPPRRARRSVEPAPTPVRDEGTDTLYRLLALQTFDGSFSSEVALALAVDPSKYRAAVAAHGEAVVLTTLVLLVLARDHRERKGEWRAAAEKARAFLDRFPSFDGSEVLA